MTDMTLTRTDTGTHAALSADVERIYRPLGEHFAQCRRELDVLFAADLDELIRDVGPETMEWPPFPDAADTPGDDEPAGTELPRRQYTADDIAALLGVDLLVKARWDLNAMRNPEAVARVNEGLRRLWPVQPDSVNTPEPDPVAEFMAADDPDERPGRAVPDRYDPALAAQARAALTEQARRQCWTPQPRGDQLVITDNGNAVIFQGDDAPHGRYRGPRNPIARRVDGWLERRDGRFRRWLAERFTPVKEDT